MCGASVGTYEVYSAEAHIENDRASLRTSKGFDDRCRDCMWPLLQAPNRIQAFLGLP